MASSNSTLDRVKPKFPQYQLLVLCRLHPIAAALLATSKTNLGGAALELLMSVVDRQYFQIV